MADVAVPKTATAFAKLAEQHGWSVTVRTGRGTPLDADGEQVREIAYVDKSDEEGGGRRQVRGDVKVIDLVVVSARRGADWVWASWEDGSAQAAHRMTGPLPGAGLAAAKAHLAVTAEHRWIDSDRGDQVCLHHSERRARP